MSQFLQVLQSIICTCSYYWANFNSATDSQLSSEKHGACIGIAGAYKVRCHLLPGALESTTKSLLPHSLE